MKKRSKKVTVTIDEKTVLGFAVGGGATVVANKFLEKIDAIKNNPQADYIIGGIEAVGGYLLATQFKEPFIKAAGVGMIGGAAVKIVEATGFATANVEGTPNLISYRANTVRTPRRKSAI